MDLSFVIVFGLLLKAVASAELREDDRNTADALQVLTIKLDRMTLDFHRLESRLQTQIEELKSAVNTLKTTAKDSQQKLELTRDMKTLIEDSVRKQATIVYRTLTAEKRQMVELKRNIKSDIAVFMTKTGDSMNALKGYLEDTSLKLGEEVRTANEKVRSNLSEILADIQVHNETLDTLKFQEWKLAGQAAETANTISSLLIKIATNTNSISSHSIRISSITNGLAQVSSKASSNTDNISSLSSRIFSNSDRISGIISDRDAFSSFSAYLTNKLPNFPKEKRIVFDYVITNRGSDYSSSTGIYTAPVSGYYIFLFNVQCYTDKTAHVELRRNGLATGMDIVATSYDGAPDVINGDAGFIYLSKGDKVWIQTASFKSTYDIWRWRTTFSGALLYAI